MNSGCFNDGDVRKLNGAMVMFLTGIIPFTGSLDLGFIEEGGSENIASYSSAILQFDYANHRIRIPVKMGELKFIFGAEPAIWNFSKDGTYDISFAVDWNSITGAKLVSDYDKADINRDGAVDVFDVVAFSFAYESKVGDTNWNDNADLKRDLKMDLYDALILASHFGEHYS